MNNTEIVFVVECTQNCHEHAWHTRHDEAKYNDFFKRIAASIIDRIPNAIIMKNQIPKSYLPFDLYNNLVPNEDENTPYFQQVPRVGAFEISYKGLLVFSKLQGGYWPNCDLVAYKCEGIVHAEQNGHDYTEFLAGNTPLKGGGFVKSAKKGRPGAKVMGSPSPTRTSKMQHQQPSGTNIQQQFAVPDESLRVQEQAYPDQGNQPKFAGQQTDVTQISSPDQMTGLPVFPPGTKSLLSKCLTQDVWDQLHDKKDPYGFSFKEAIWSGCKNLDSGIGVYAGSHDSYTTFAPMMDKVIEEYHGHKKTDIHPKESGKLNAPDFPPEEAAMIKSTRIRVGRNLAGYPLGPGVTQAQRAEIESKVTTALKTFDGDLKGTYYPLEGMQPDVQKKLIEDHFLFKEGDRFLDACGLNREWPKNRGIFHNDTKTFLTWVNEEDQLRIISMQQGSNIRQVFERLLLALEKFEKVAKFSFDDHNGYITSCPTNLGTAMRASVHICLPLLSKNKEEFQAIADKYYVQIRGAHGEHTETDDGIFDISNRRRLGRSMTDLVQDMYDGVKQMIQREMELQKSAGGGAGAAAPKQAAAPAKAAAAGSVQAGPHLKDISQLTGPVEFPAGTKSLLCKYLTPEIFNKFKGTKDKAGVPFELMCLSGAQNVDSGIGLYAGSHDSYTTYAELFDKVIEDYHGHKKDGKHVSDMDHTKLKCPPFSKEDDARILSTRIRVGRNLAAYPLGPGISAAQRNEVEATVSKVLIGLDGDLKGKYYPLKGMPKADQDQLIADHFLFKEGDRFLQACGLNREWPDGRGIFHNDAKTFLTWVNEEDQLRIISMEKGSDIGGVFSRLARGAAAIEKVAKFAHDDHLGYITSCPTNCGTALRASVHIKLPLLGSKANKADFEAIAAKYFVQIRGIHGEHSETDDGIFDISNRRRLGRSEAQLVQDMYDGVKAMMDAENALEKKGGAAPAQAAPAQAAPAGAPAAGGMVKAGPHLKDIKDLTGPVEFPAGTKSLVCKYLTPEIFNKYKGTKDKAGVPFELMVLSGCQNVDSGIGVYAGSHDSYTTYAELFDKIIEDYHGHKKDGKHVSDMDHTKLKCPPFSKEDDARILSTRIRVGRNLAAYPLGPGISAAQRNECEATVSKVLIGLDGDLKGQYYPLKGMAKADQDKLIADHFLFKEGDRFLSACGLNREWPDGRGIFHNDAKTFLTWVNEEDQLRIISMEKGSDIGGVFSRLARGAAAIEKAAKFAHDDHLGYITSCPTNCGTALRASVHIKLPLLGSKANKADFEAIAAKYFVQIRGIHGEHSETDDGIFDISNRRRLGRSEAQLVQDMYDGVKAMMDAETALEKKGGAAPAQAAPAGAPAAGAVVKAGPHLKDIKDLTGPVEFPAGTKSMVAKYMTPEIFNKFKGTKDKAGVPFELMVLSGCQNVDSGIGVYAGSHDSYTTYAELFDKIIEDYHGHKKDGKHVSDMDHTKLKCPPFSKEDDAMIISTRIRVGRNLAAYPLGPGISAAQRNECEATVSKVLTALDGDLKGKYYPLKGMAKADQDQLIADHFLFKEGDRFLQACGLNREWPDGRGIFHNDAKTFLTWVNEEDQLRIISMEKGSDIGGVFSRLARGAAAIEKAAKFAHDDHLGYITSCPTNCGTALRASVHIKLPLLGSKANKADFEAIAAKYFVQIRGIHGEHSETDDGIFDISNRRRLGRSEAQLVQDMYDGVKAMIEAEKALMAKAPAAATAPAATAAPAEPAKK